MGRADCNGTSAPLQVIHFHKLIQFLHGGSLTHAGSGFGIAKSPGPYQCKNTCPNLTTTSPIGVSHHTQQYQVRSYYAAQQHKSPPKLQDFFDFYDCFLTDILTRYPWHQASLLPSQMPTEEEKLACQTRSGHQSAAAALHQSCSSEHSTSP